MLILTHPHFFGRHIFHIHVMVLRRHENTRAARFFIKRFQTRLVRVKRNFYVFRAIVDRNTFHASIFSPPSR